MAGRGRDGRSRGGAKHLVLTAKPAVLDRTLDRDPQFIPPEGLGHVVEGPLPHRFDRGLD